MLLLKIRPYLITEVRLHLERLVQRGGGSTANDNFAVLINTTTGFSLDYFIRIIKFYGNQTFFITNRSTCSTGNVYYPQISS